ncbi:MAG: 4Fe-4S binding protein [Sphaerochaetaceae bacterium]|nr:4Fe-4S binding protein [Sphaerochaetaceae bacterium]
MKLAVLSGKGGTGKTFISVNLVNSAENANYYDCDVEEPNGDLFFKSKLLQELPVKVKMPNFDKEKCNACHECVEACTFNALALIGKDMLLFEDVCHSCGVCTLVCKQKAITEVDKEVGIIQVGEFGNSKIVTGKLNMGQSSGVPVISGVLDLIEEDKLNVIDCPPGSACSVVESTQKADYCLIVAEPTSFGFHNFKMVEQLAKVLNKPFAVVVNKAESKNNMISAYCKKNDIKVLETFFFNRKIAQDNSRGEICTSFDNKMKDRFVSLLESIKDDWQRSLK